MTDCHKKHTSMIHKAMSAILVVFVVLLSQSEISAAPNTVTVEGVNFNRYVRLESTNLALRGCGLLRYMIFIKAYVAAFYLPESIRSEDALGDVAKHLEIEYFHAIPAQDFAKATSASIARNTSLTTFRKLKPKIEEFNTFYRDIAPGDRYALTYIPGQGTTLYWNSQPLGTVASREFAAELFGIWLGSKPLDRDLKRVLLGG